MEDFLGEIKEFCGLNPESSKKKKDADKSADQDFWDLKKKNGKDVLVRVAELQAEQILEMYNKEKVASPDLTFETWADKIKLPKVNFEKVKAIMKEATIGKKADRATKCPYCGKPIKECPVGGDPNKVCGGHTRKEREEFEKANPKASLNKKSDSPSDFYNDAQNLVRYTYTKMQEFSPEDFINFILGGHLGVYTEMEKEANIIARDFDEGGPWIDADSEFNRLVKKYQQANPKYKEQDDGTFALSTKLKSFVDKKAIIRQVRGDAVEIGREEAYELCGGELPTSKKERLIVRQIGHPQGDEVVWKEGDKYYIASISFSDIESSDEWKVYDENLDKDLFEGTYGECLEFLEGDDMVKYTIDNKRKMFVLGENAYD